MSQLRPCQHCARHVRIDENACPFCSRALAAVEAAPLRDLGRPTSRAAVVFFGAAATIAACSSGGPDPGPSSSSSGGSSSGLTSSSSGGSSSGGSSSGGSSSGGSSGADLPAYGPAVVDAGED